MEEVSWSLRQEDGDWHLLSGNTHLWDIGDKFSKRLDGL